MAEAIVLALALFASFCAMVWFALAKTAHWRQVRGGGPRGEQGGEQVGENRPSPRARSVFTIAGWLALGLSLWLCLMADAPSMAALVWVMSLALAALAVGMLLSWRPRWLRPWLLVFG